VDTHSSWGAGRDGETPRRVLLVGDAAGYVEIERYNDLGRLLGLLTVYVEVYDRVDTATLTGRLCRPFTRLMLVQWPEQLGLYRDAELVGPLL